MKYIENTQINVSVRTICFCYETSIISINNRFINIQFFSNKPSLHLIIYLYGIRNENRIHRIPFDSIRQGRTVIFVVFVVFYKFISNVYKFKRLPRNRIFASQNALSAIIINALAALYTSEWRGKDS